MQFHSKFSFFYLKRKQLERKAMDQRILKDQGSCGSAFILDSNPLFVQFILFSPSVTRWCPESFRNVLRWSYCLRIFSISLLEHLLVVPMLMYWSLVLSYFLLRERRRSTSSVTKYQLYWKTIHAQLHGVKSPHCLVFGTQHPKGFLGLLLQ